MTPEGRGLRCGRAPLQTGAEGRAAPARLQDASRRHINRRTAAPRNGPARGDDATAAAPAAPPGPSPPGRGPAPSAGRASQSTLRPRAARPSPTTTGPAPHRRPGTTGNADTGGKSSNATVIAASAHRCCTICPTGSRNTASNPPKRPTAAHPARLRAAPVLVTRASQAAPADAHRRSHDFLPRTSAVSATEVELVVS